MISVTDIQSAIPITENCILALQLNWEKRTEHILLGELRQVQVYLRGNKQANILAEQKRELGRLATECWKLMSREMNDVRIGLAQGLGKKLTPLFGASQNFLEDLYQSDNLCYRFLAVRLWSEYRKIKILCAKQQKSPEDEAYRGKFVDRIEDLTLPFRIDTEKIIMDLQCDHPKDPLHYFDREFFKHPCGLLWADNLATNEYCFATVSLMPLLMYGLNRLYGNHLYFQRCKLCRKVFLAKTANIPTYCDEDCKREAVRLNKRRFDEKARTLNYERQHKNSYMYWYNKLKKLQKEAPGSDKLTKVQAAFDTFKAGNAKHKTAVKEGRLPEKEYIDWLYSQQAVIDGLMESGGKDVEGASHE